MIKWNRKILLILAGLALVSCSSNPPKDNRTGAADEIAHMDQSNGENPANEGGPGDDSAAKNINPDQLVKGPATSNYEMYRRFNQARTSHQTRAAVEAAAEILAHNPNDFKVLNALAVMAIEQDRFDLARLYISKVLEKNPNNSAAYNNLGIIELKTDNLRQALINFKKAIELDGSNKAAHANLGAIYLKYRNFQSAAEELQAAAGHGDQSVETLTNLGFALTRIGKYDEAEKYYETALSKDASRGETMLDYAALLVEHLKQYDKGLKLINKIRFVAHEPAILERADALARKAQNPSSSKPVSQDKEIPIENASE